MRETDLLGRAPPPSGPIAPTAATSATAPTTSATISTALLHRPGLVVGRGRGGRGRLRGAVAVIARGQGDGRCRVLRLGAARSRRSIQRTTVPSL